MMSGDQGCAAFHACSESSPPAPALLNDWSFTGKIQLVAIGASTGGLPVPLNNDSVAFATQPACPAAHRFNTSIPQADAPDTRRRSGSVPRLAEVTRDRRLSPGACQ